jgi:hypothetical protein
MNNTTLTAYSYGYVYSDAWHMLDLYVNRLQEVRWTNITDEQVREYIEFLCDRIMQNSFNA